MNKIIFVINLYFNASLFFPFINISNMKSVVGSLLLSILFLCIYAILLQYENYNLSKELLSIKNGTRYSVDKANDVSSSSLIEAEIKKIIDRLEQSDKILILVASENIESYSDYSLVLRWLERTSDTIESDPNTRRDWYLQFPRYHRLSRNMDKRLLRVAKNLVNACDKYRTSLKGEYYSHSPKIESTKQDCMLATFRSIDRGLYECARSQAKIATNITNIIENCWEKHGYMDL